MGSVVSSVALCHERRSSRSPPGSVIPLGLALALEDRDVVDAHAVTGVSATFEALGTTVFLAVRDLARLALARRLAERVLADVDQVCSRSRDDSDLTRVNGRSGVEGGKARRSTEVSDLGHAQTSTLCALSEASARKKPGPRQP